jgi:hypothetical protein
VDIKRDRGYKEDKYRFTLVNFKNLIHMEKQIIDESYVLSLQVLQVF